LGNSHTHFLQFQQHRQRLQLTVLGALTAAGKDGGERQAQLIGTRTAAREGDGVGGAVNDGEETGDNRSMG
jgi:hypothetical protein